MRSTHLGRLESRAMLHPAHETGGRPQAGAIWRAAGRARIWPWLDRATQAFGPKSLSLLLVIAVAGAAFFACARIAFLRDRCGGLNTKIPSPRAACAARRPCAPGAVRPDTPPAGKKTSIVQPACEHSLAPRGARCAARSRRSRKRPLFIPGRRPFCRYFPRATSLERRFAQSLWCNGRRAPSAPRARPPSGRP